MKPENTNVQEQKKRGRKPLVNPLMKYWVKTIKNLPATDYNTEKYDVNKMKAAFDEALEQTKSFDDKRLVNTIVQMPLILCDKDNEISKLHNVINNQDKEIRDKNYELTKFCDTINSQTEELNGAYNKIANLEKINKELESLKPTIENYKIIIKNKDITIDSLRKELEQSKCDIDELTAIKNVVVENNKEKRNQITNLEDQISNYRKTLKTYKVLYWVAFIVSMTLITALIITKIF